MCFLHNAQRRHARAVARVRLLEPMNGENQPDGFSNYNVRRICHEIHATMTF